MYNPYIILNQFAALTPNALLAGGFRRNGLTAWGWPTGHARAAQRPMGHAHAAQRPQVRPSSTDAFDQN